jgi:3-oxoacyl-[acyl-carrier protein] reductase
MQLSDVKAIVTGGAQGLGAHFATRLREAGAQVCAGDINQAALDSLAPPILRRSLDVSDESQVAEFVHWAAEKMGGLNVLINNAGILRDGLLVKRDKVTQQISTLPLKQFEQVIDVNLTGAVLMVREAVARMAHDNVNQGVVVNMSSIARHGNRGQSNYVAAKAALAANTVTWAREFAPFRVRVGAVAPGLIDTPMTQGMNQDALERMVKNIPCQRLGNPEDIWQAVRFVLECDYFNGRTIDVDGGLGF